MKYNESFWESFSQPNSFIRVDADHILDLYVGIDDFGRRSLLLETTKEPPKLKSTKQITVTQLQRDDGTWFLWFSLEGKTANEEFTRFCQDMIESSRCLESKDNGARFLCTKYRTWCNLYANLFSHLLSEIEIQGLIGELLFLKDKMIPLYGEDKSIQSWIGSQGTKQDFVVDDTWYELKTTLKPNGSVTISSIEQLDASCDGFLVVCNIQKTSPMDASAVTLNELYQVVLKGLHSDELRTIFSQNMTERGYQVNEVYDDKAYKLQGFDFYQVNATFPCLRRESLPESVITCAYELSIPAIADYKVEG